MAKQKTRCLLVGLLLRACASRAPSATRRAPTATSHSALNITFSREDASASHPRHARGACRQLAASRQSWRITPEGGWRGCRRCSEARLCSLSSSARRFLPPPAAHAETLARAPVCASVNCMVAAGRNGEPEHPPIRRSRLIESVLLAWLLRGDHNRLRADFRPGCVDFRT